MIKCNLMYVYYGKFQILISEFIESRLMLIYYYWTYGIKCICVVTKM